MRFESFSFKINSFASLIITRTRSAVDFRVLYSLICCVSPFPLTGVENQFTTALLLPIGNTISSSLIRRLSDCFLHSCKIFGWRSATEAAKFIAEFNKHLSSKFATFPTFSLSVICASLGGFLMGEECFDLLGERVGLEVSSNFV